MDEVDNVDRLKRRVNWQGLEGYEYSRYEACYVDKLIERYPGEYSIDEDLNGELRVFRIKGYG